MRNPYHKVKRYVYNSLKPYWYEDEAYGWRSTEVEDKNGREIFEGDLVNCKPYRIVEGVIDFSNGTFWADAYPLHEIKPNDIEVVGHIAEKEQ